MVSPEVGHVLRQVNELPDLFLCPIFFTVKMVPGGGATWQDMEGPTLIKCRFRAKRTTLYLLSLRVKSTEIKLFPVLCDFFVKYQFL